MFPATDRMRPDMLQSADQTGHRYASNSMARKAAFQNTYATMVLQVVDQWSLVEMRLCRTEWEDPPGPRRGFSGVRRNTIMTSLPLKCSAKTRPKKTNSFPSSQGPPGHSAMLDVTLGKALREGSSGAYSTDCPCRGSLRVLLVSLVPCI